MNGPKISMDNSNLIKKLREHFLVKPFEENKGKIILYILSNISLIDSSMKQSAEIAKMIDYTVINYINYINVNINLFSVQKGGFFIEYDALDDETIFNKLYFERYCGWTGLLIEIDL